MNTFTKMQDMKILLIDDDELIRDSLRLFFEEEGCSLLTVETAEEGLETIKKQTYDIIIADYRLPGIDGLEFFKRIQQSCHATLKILITAYESNISSKLTKIGVHDVISKPFSPKVIEASLSRLLKTVNVA